ncbi:MAG: hypothetical protein HGA44_02745 [Cellulomonadaceae bacterium]|nr:hypothetical protein [Cellulomonadaceae bacterium]
MVKDPIRSHEALVTDELVRTRTGRGRDEWFADLDALGAVGWTHTVIAAWLVDQGVDGWWAQSVTLGYEQARGRRVPGQRADGTFETTVTKTLPAPLDTAVRWLTDPELRAAWLDVEVDERGSTPGKRVRWGLPDGSRVTVHLLDLPPGRSRFAVQHQALAGADAVTTAKHEWAARLATLTRALEAHTTDA